MAEVLEIDIKPNSPPQWDAFASDDYEVLYGGASGGGKTWWVVVDPMRYIHLADYTAVIFRRSYPELEGGIIPLTQKYYLQAGATYNDQKKLYTFPSGATIRLGYLQSKDDWNNYQGHEYAGQYFDELTNIHWNNYQTLAAWNRSHCINVPPYRRAASNPGGLSHAAVKGYFVDKCPPVPDGERKWSELANMFWQPMKAGKSYEYKDTVTDRKLSRKFIPARVFDNEDLLRMNPNYLTQLLNLPGEKKKAYLEGDWSVFEGQFFSSFSPDIHIIEPKKNFSDCGIRMASARGGLDYGYITVLEVGYRDYEGNIINFAEHYSQKQTPEERAEDIAEFLKTWGLKKLQIIYDTDMEHNLQYYSGAEKTPIQFFKDVFRLRLKENAPIMRVVSKKSEDDKRYRVVCNEFIKQMLDWKKNERGEFVKRPKLYITSNCTHLIQSLPELVHDPDSLAGLDFDSSIGSDHEYDALKCYALDLRTPVRKQEIRGITTMDEYMDKEFEKIIDKFEKGKEFVDISEL
jgi:hypothetical protein